MDEQILRGQENGTPPELVISREEYAYGFIIEVLTTGLYPEKRHVLREYVQNSYDAIMDLRRAGLDDGNSRIEIRVEPPSVCIFDTGIGMDSRRMSEYRYVGYSKKLTRESVGFRGIGKLSGISAAGKIIVTTTPYGVAERHRLVFDAEAMLARVEALKEHGDNIALNRLITEHSSLSTEDEDADAHYTLVELYDMREDAKDLLVPELVTEYLGLTGPVGFDPAFPFGGGIDADLRKYIHDYDTVPLEVNGQPIYKPFLADLKAPQSIMVWPDDQPEDDATSSLLAYCWYCEHSGKGQLVDKQHRGLVYRVKNFAVGEGHLPRVTLWHTTPERAFYFFGEIHVCDPEVVPSASRIDFEQNAARDRLYRRCSAQISRTLTKVAGESSDTRRAIEFVGRAEELTARIGSEVENRTVPAELRVNKIVDLSNAATEVAKRLKNAPEEFKDRGERAIEVAKDLVKRLDEGPDDGEGTSPVYDITDEAHLGTEAKWVYDTVMEVLREILSGRGDLFEEVIRRIHGKLRSGR